MCCFCLRAAYNVVGYYGTKAVSYKEALAAIFIEGWIFIFLSLVGARCPVWCTTPTSHECMFLGTSDTM